MITAIVQARLGSTRLPNKVLMEVKNKPLLQHLIDRLRKSKHIKHVVIATTTAKQDKGIVDFVKSLKLKNVTTFQGSEDDVLDRYYHAAKENKASVVVRITADCPLIDPTVVDKTIQFYLDNKDEYDYVSNRYKLTYPDGLDTEVVPFAMLEKAWHEASKKADREHVTTYLWKNPKKFRIGNVAHTSNLSAMRWTVDYPEDFEFVKAVLENKNLKKDFLLKDVLDLLEKKPEIAKLNANIAKQEWLEIVNKERDDLSKQGLYDFVQKLSNLPLEDTILADDMKIGNMPLWWFFKSRFERNILPPLFPNWNQIISALEKGKKKPARSIRTKALLLRKAIHQHEKLKRFMAPKQNIPKNKATILFTPHTNAVFEKDGKLSVDRIGDVIDLLEKEKGTKNLMVLIDPISQRFSRKKSKFPNYFPGFISKDIMKEARKKGKQLSMRWRQIVPQLLGQCSETQKKYFAFLKPALDFYFSRELITLIASYYLTYKKIMQEANVCALVLYESAGIIERCAIAAAHEQNIPSARIYHGFGFSNKQWDLPHTNYLFAYGVVQKERMIRLGAAPGNVVVTGPVFLGDYKPFVTTPATDLSKQKKFNILFCTSTFIEENKLSFEDYFAYMRRYLKELTSIPGAHIMLKVHPREHHLEGYRAIIEEENMNKVILIENKLGKTQIYQLIKEADFVVSFFSTVLFESSLIGKPTFMIELYERSQIDSLNYFFDNLFSVVSIQPDDNVAAPLLNVINNPAELHKLNELRKKFIIHYIHQSEQGPQQEAVSAIQNIIGQYKKY